MKMHKGSRLLLIGFVASLVCSSIGWTQSPATPLTNAKEVMCPNGRIWGAGLISNVCWSCLFPIRLMGLFQLGQGGTAPDGAADESVCICHDDEALPSMGFAAGMWAPTSLIELVRKPYCSPVLAGSTIRESFRMWGMGDGADGGPASNQFMNVHEFSFPLYEILELLLAPECNAGGFVDVDLKQMSEIDPSWNDPELPPFMYPEVVIASNPLLQAACPVDCAAATFDTPVDRMWWCAGCWGNLYPFAGSVPSGGSPPRVSSLLATRGLASMHRRGLAYRTVGNDVLCGGKVYPMLPKSQYKFSMLYPIPEADPSTRVPRVSFDASGIPKLENYEYKQGCCHNIGTPTLMWGEWRNIPAIGEDFVYSLWRWTDCCVR